MRRNIIIKALVLGTIGCAFSATGFAANVQNGHGQGIADSTTEVNGAKHEAVRSSWMDRTDIVVGVGMKKSEESSSHQYNTIILCLGKIILSWGLLINPNLQNLTSYTLRHYNL